MKQLYAGWMRLAKFLGRINSRILLTIFYFLIFGPIALIRRVFLLSKKTKNQNSTWQDKEEMREGFFKQQF